ncbi:MAG TPA: PP2C family serine/threonine-protein phosphatase [Polyangia bacterium]|nr:PP2C family serine/threonine-protein phosphatase [Polyangia bacterium]
MPWRVFAASATGPSHREDGRPCQDAFAHRTDGDTLIAVVCDGAGSCELSHVGARVVSESVVHAIAAQLGSKLVQADSSPEQWRKVVETVIASARDALQAVAKAAAGDVSAYASTLVGAVAWPSRLFFFHVGDGYAVARPRAADAPDIVSLPENGEYVNETYFVTGNEWQAHLRMAVHDVPIETVVLMSDGAAPFAIAKGNKELHRPFIDPVQRYLDQATEAEGNAALARTLEDPRTDSITTDDKTLLIARWR